MKHQLFYSRCYVQGSSEPEPIKSRVNMGLTRDNPDITMAVNTPDHVVHITKQQVMDFFGLVEPAPVVNPEDHSTTDEFFGYKDLQDYLNHLYDILYIKHDDATVVRHMQETGADRIDAIKRARAQLGDEPYIISCTKHVQDVNPLDKE